MTFILLVHIAGGIAAAIAGSYSAYVLLRRDVEKYRGAALWLGALAVLEIGTGTLMAVFSDAVSAALVCERIAIYMAAATLLESALFIRMRNAAIRFPVSVIPGVSMSSVALIGAFVLGF